MSETLKQEEETKIWRQVFKKQIKLKMERYMERNQVDTKYPKSNTWGPDRDRDRDKDRDGDHQTGSGHRDAENDVSRKTEYITRLTSLRDSLIDQEELNLAQALERLRLHSITNKSHSNRLRMNTNDDFISAQPLINQRRNMISTVERFRQIRPRRHQPVIFPLQGRQMLDVPRPASEEPIANFGNSTNRSDRLYPNSFNLGSQTSRPNNAKVEETVQTNLQRLIQRTSSIPNIGRKALKQQEDLEPKAKPLLNIRAKLQKQPGPLLASPFQLSTHEPPHDPDNPHQESSERDVHNLSPQAFKLGPVLQGDMINMDVLQQYYQSYIDSGSPSEPNNTSKPNHATTDRRDHRNATHGSPYQQKSNSRAHPFRTNTMTNKSYPLSSPVTRYNSIVSGTGKVIALSDLPDIMPRTTYTFYSTNTQSSSINEGGGRGGDQFEFDKTSGRFPELQTAYRYHMGQSDASSTASGVSRSWLRSVHRRRRNNSPVEEEDRLHDIHSEHPLLNNKIERSLTQDGRMKIVVDMPNIIFNAASPDGGDGSSDTGHGQGYSQGQGQTQSQVQGHVVKPENVLRKARKQQEIRKKELNNLLDDVKELNMMSEVLAGSSIAHGT